MTPQGSADIAQDPPENGLLAVKRFLRFSTGMLEPGEKPPLMPEGLQEWPETVLPGVLAGVLFGGYSKWRDVAAERLPSLGPHGLPSPTFTLQRAFRVLDSATRGGLTVGSLAALFFSVEMLVGVYRGHRAFMQDAAVGGAAVGTVFAAHRITHTRVWPPPDLAANTASIVAIGLVQGLLQKLQHNDRMRQVAVAAAAEDERLRQEAAAARKADAASLLLAQLEASLSSGPAGTTQQQPDLQQGKQQAQQQPGWQPDGRQVEQQAGQEEQEQQAGKSGAIAGQAAGDGGRKKGWWPW